MRNHLAEGFLVSALVRLVIRRAGKRRLVWIDPVRPAFEPTSRHQLTTIRLAVLLEQRARRPLETAEPLHVEREQLIVRQGRHRRKYPTPQAATSTSPAPAPCHAARSYATIIATAASILRGLSGCAFVTTVPNCVGFATQWPTCLASSAEPSWVRSPSSTPATTRSHAAAILRRSLVGNSTTTSP